MVDAVDDYESFTYTYHDYTVEYMPVAMLQGMLKDDPYTYTWKAKDLIKTVHYHMLKESYKDDVHGLCISSHLKRITYDGGLKRLRGLFYLAVTGLHPINRYMLRVYEPEPNCVELEKLTIEDRKTLSKRVGEERRKSLQGNADAKT